MEEPFFNIIAVSLSLLKVKQSLFWVYEVENAVRALTQCTDIADLA